ncbi:MAG: DUF4381 domain-containing protein [Desulfuromonadaceae bacterium]|nr:DUF4381 domain-containing protein [Desulfuromonadaceae bacterium]
MQIPNVDPLAGLRDIHLPDAVGWWPPALGWWGVAGMLGLTLVLLGWWLRQRRLLQHQRLWQGHGQRMALQQLERLRQEHLEQPDTLVRELSVLLRRGAILHYPDANCAALAGQEWLSFLDRTLGAGGVGNSLDTAEGSAPDSFSLGVGQCLADAPYRPPATTAVDSAALLDLVQRWLEGLPPLAEPSSEPARRR